MLKNVSYKNIFLIDGMGAVLTALLLSQLLARLVPVFGMPSAILYPLAAIAACFAIYSLLCHLLVKKNWKPFLRGIAVANTLYCLTDIGLGHLSMEFPDLVGHRLLFGRDFDRHDFGKGRD
jgi:hypothetical protein